MCADSWAVTVWRIASAARLCQSRGHRTERGQSSPSAWHYCGHPSAKLASSPGRADRARPIAAPAQPRSGQCPVPRAWSQRLAHYSPRPGPAHVRQVAQAAQPPRAPPSQRGRGRAARSPEHGPPVPRRSRSVYTPDVTNPRSRGKCPSSVSRSAGLAPFTVNPCIRCKPRINPGPSFFVQLGLLSSAAHTCRDLAPSSATFPIIFQPC
jgi:hypothetical protein